MRRYLPLFVALLLLLPGSMWATAVDSCFDRGCQCPCMPDEPVSGPAFGHSCCCNLDAPTPAESRPETVRTTAPAQPPLPDLAYLPIALPVQDSVLGRTDATLALHHPPRAGPPFAPRLCVFLF